MAPVTESVSLDVRDGVAMLTVDNPPVNALSHHVRTGIADGVEQAVADDSVEAIVLLCAGRTFIAGADITEFGGARQGRSLQEAQAAMEDSPKPVVAAIHGTALGGGLETAMAAHYRVGDPGSRYGLPEVKLGLLPGAGGTQRLPRVTGVQKALEMMTSGDMIGADEALECGLISEIVGSGPELEQGAIAFAKKVVAEGRPLIKIRDDDSKLETAKDDPEIFARFRSGIARKTRGFLAPEYNVQCIEAAVNLPFDEGLAVERRLFDELMSGTQSKAQRYYFFAEREAAKIPDVPRDTPQIEINTCGIVGAGTMGGGIAMNFANVGIPVTIVERDQESLDKGLAVVRSNYERTAGRGRITMDDVETRMGLISGATSREALADCDIVIEAVFEFMDLKKEIFADLDRICKPGALLATNTSALDVNEIAAATSRPESVIGMHFFSPANVMKLLENVRGDETSDTVIATAMAVGKRIGKSPTLVGVCHGFVGNRILAQRRIEADRMSLEGAPPAMIDDVLYDFGFPMGPFAMSDLAGLDIGWNPEASSGSTVKELMNESGRRGQKNGRGYYTYDPETREKTPDLEVVDLIRTFAEGQGIGQREFTEEVILERCLLPMVNEGAKILEEGIAIRPSDIDVIWINGYGWPVYTGGPMFWADTMGLDVVVEKIRHYAETVGGRHWELSPLLERLAAEGTTFQAFGAGAG